MRKYIVGTLVLAIVPLQMGGCPGPGGVVSERVTPCPSDAATFTKMNDATFAVVLEIRTGPGAGDLDYFTLGTAFAVGERLLATNAHITEFFNEFCGFEITDVFAVQSGTGVVVHLLRALTHPDYDGDPFRSPDVGLLTCLEALPITLEMASPEELNKLALGDELLLAGFPGDVQARFEILPGVTVPQATSLSGRITAFRSHSDNVMVTMDTRDVIQHQTPTSPGTSGSALIGCGKVVAINNAGTVQEIVTVNANGDLVQDRVAAANNNFGVHAKYITEMMTLFTAQALQGFKLPPEALPCAADGSSPNGECGPGTDPICDFCWVTGNGTSCPESWIGDGDCDCGCQFPDTQDCNPGQVIPAGCNCDAIFDDSLEAANNEDLCAFAEALIESLSCNCCAVIQDLCVSLTENELLEARDRECAIVEPPADTCPSGCRRGSVCCGFPLCAGACIGSPCCN